MTALSEIGARLAAATSGPWFHDWNSVYTEDGQYRAGFEIVRANEEHPTIPFLRHRENMALIANAPTDISFLLALLEECRPYVEEISKAPMPTTFVKKARALLERMK